MVDKEGNVLATHLPELDRRIVADPSRMSDDVIRCTRRDNGSGDGSGSIITISTFLLITATWWNVKVLEVWERLGSTIGPKACVPMRIRPWLRLRHRRRRQVHQERPQQQALA